jgi:Family of unknown function (DUF6455)
MDYLADPINIDGASAFAFVNQGRLMASIVRTCQVCKAGKRCETWLEKSSPVLERAPEFCPNQTNLDVSKKVI